MTKITMQDLETIHPYKLTFLLEDAAKEASSEQIVPILLKALQHKSALVREGAVIGLYFHTDALGVKEKVVDISSTDESPGVRETALSIIDDSF